MFAYDYPLLGILLSMLTFFLFVIWIWIAVMVMLDVFRSSDLGGVAKFLWIMFIIVIPYLGVFVYLIARGGKMQERRIEDARASEAAFKDYVQQASGADTAGQLEKLADLRDRGVVTPEEFEAQKAKLLA